ncbi:MAG: hypothetical protein H7Y32_18395 [Chloroflexales bacterium]|nr:hypothetical protein [Chloroflexales bacterium]
MQVAELLLVLTALLTFFNTGLQYYTTVSTYPLFSDLAAEAFVPYHQAYERRLPFAIYVPYTLLMLTTILLAFVRPASVALGWVFVLLALNGSIMAVSLAFAAPIHARLDREGKNERWLHLLRRYNLPRLLAASASSLILCLLLVRSFAA